MGNIEDKNKNQQFVHPILRKAEHIDSNKVMISPSPSPEFFSWIRKSREFIKSSPSPSLLLPEYEETIAQNYCGTQKSYKLIYPYFQYVLRQEILDRKVNQETFSESELWYLLYRLLQASYSFQKKKMKSGDIRPANILLDDKGEVTVINVYSFPTEKTNYQKSLRMNTTTYLSPEELGELEMKINFPKSDPVTAQAFSIGLTILDAAILHDSEELYDLKKMSFKYSVFNDNVVKLKTDKYSPFFVKTVVNLLEGKSVERITPGEALSILQPYHEEIMELKQFVPDRDKSKVSLQEFQGRK